MGQVPSLFDILWYLPSGKAVRAVESTVFTLAKARAKLHSDLADISSYLVRTAFEAPLRIINVDVVSWASSPKEGVKAT
jgi:hypothetical protein